MLITRRSIITGEENQMEIDVTQKQLDSYFVEGLLLQNAFPNLSPDEREFIKTGITPEEWNDYFRGLDEEEEE
jgi:hypothetical protein